MKDYYEMFVDGDKCFWWDRVNQKLWDDCGNPADLSWFDPRTGEAFDESEELIRELGDDFAFDVGDVIQVTEGPLECWVARVTDRYQDLNGENFYLISSRIGAAPDRECDWMEESALTRRKSWVHFQHSIGDRVTWGDGCIPGTVVGYYPGNPALYKVATWQDAQIVIALVDGREIRGLW